MKRKLKWLILAAVLVVGFATWLLLNSTGNVPIDVVGTLPEKDVAEIVALAKHKLRKDILPDFSWRSIQNLPNAYLRYANIKLYTVVSSADAGRVWVVSWYDTNGIKRSEFDRHYWPYEERAPAHLGWVSVENTNWIAFRTTNRQDGWKLAIDLQSSTAGSPKSK